MHATLERLPIAVFAGLFVVLWVAESVAAAVHFEERGRKPRNLVLLVVNFLLGGLGAAVMLAAAGEAERRGWGLAAAADNVFAVLIGVAVLDLSDYGRHRLSHAWPPLWRLHRLHHTDPHVDLTTALRSHPLEQLVRPLLLAAVILALGVPVLAVLAYPLLVLPVLLFQHANVDLPRWVDRLLVGFVSTPAMHRVHHSRVRSETDSNFATGLTCWDRLFGSWSPSETPHGVGQDGYDETRSRTMKRMLLDPWRAAAAQTGSQVNTSDDRSSV